MRQFFLLSALIFSPILAGAQTLSPAVISTSGGYFTGGGNTLSWTIGEPAQSSLTNAGIVLTQGQQQPFIEVRLLNLKAYIQGFYAGNGLMTPVLYNNYPGDFSPDDCDSITVELRSGLSPYSLLSTKSAILQTNGTVQLEYPSSFAGSAYYIVIRHRNALEVWSKYPISFNAAAVAFDFSAP